ncbi:FadD3 family acyl-CoA ligase [Nocardioides litoris]|uniref:FadD3 family acyl-CoA ligase n=1 Tax=Nocardioides litoris TaxID=1926648 RepID=UPI0024821109|nr:FadD3 family acyl-CoA ligase [Nocardioides litoris]
MTASTLPDLVREAAAAHADAPAYVEGDRTTTYAELHRLVESASMAYVTRGVCCGDKVVLWGPNSTDWAVAALAVSYAGGVLVPVNSRYVGAEVADVVERTGAAMVVVHDGFLGRDQVGELAAAGVTAEVVTLASIAHATPQPWQHGGARPDDVADILFTSGTTGRSKGAMSAHRQTVGVARTWAELGGVRSEDRYLVLNPFFHSFGYKIGIVVGLLTGCALYPAATFDVTATMELVDRERITVLPGAPTIYQSLLAAPDRASYDLSSLRLAVTGAAVVPQVLIERMRDAAPEGLGVDQVVTAFGMTEAVVVTMCRDGDPAETVAGTCGRAVPGMEVRIEAGTGELLVRGEHVMLGYLDDPEATAAAVDADGWLHTGDVGTLDEQGNLRITDRLKDMYISGGFNVYPAEVEQALLRLDGVDDVAVVGVPDERMGEVGRAYVVGAAPADEVVAFARERLAGFKVPRQVVHVDTLPRNLSGKVLKNELRDGG